MEVDDVRDVPLTASAEAERHALVEQQLEAILEVLKQPDDREGICWACLDPGQDEYAEIATVTLARAADREAVLADVDLAEEWIEAWNPAWCREEDEILMPAPAKPAAEAYAALMDCLEVRVLDPKRWVALRVAACLNRTPLRLKTTDDFVVFVQNPELGDDLIEELRFVARPEIFDLLQQRGLIGEPEYR